MFLYIYSIHDKFEKVNRKIKIGEKIWNSKDFRMESPDF